MRNVDLDGVLEDALVQVNGPFLPTGFYILDMGDAYHEIST